MLQVQNLIICVAGKEIVHGIDLSIKPGEIHAIMGPNGAGKSTLALGLMGHPRYHLKLDIGNLKFEIDNKDMTTALPEERARAGLFVSFQQPAELTGVSILSFLRTAYKVLYPDEKKPISTFRQEVNAAFAAVGLSEEFVRRSVNEGFSGGEKKRAEIAQLLVLKPKYVILDEIDSGLDIDSLKVVAQTIKKAVKQYNIGVLLITHYQRILHYLKPDIVHVLMAGKIKASGGIDLVRKIEKNGYATLLR